MADRGDNVRVVVIAAALAVIAAFGPAMAVAHARSDEGDWQLETLMAAPLGENAGAIGTSNAACTDRAYNLYGGRWAADVNWSFNAASTPAALRVKAVEAVLRKSFSNITGANNDCGRADKVDIGHDYQGRTDRQPNISRQAMCTRPDGRNVVGFGRLPNGIMAATCTRFRDGFIIESDIRINSRYGWALSVAECSGQELLQPTMTHEAGHFFGLGHVGEKRHGDLTMSTQSDGPCDNGASTLGFGDMLGLEQMY